MIINFFKLQSIKHYKWSKTLFQLYFLKTVEINNCKYKIICTVKGCLDNYWYLVIKLITSIYRCIIVTFVIHDFNIYWFSSFDVEINMGKKIVHFFLYINNIYVKTKLIYVLLLIHYSFVSNAIALRTVLVYMSIINCSKSFIAWFIISGQYSRRTLKKSNFIGLLVT